MPLPYFYLPDLTSPVLVLDEDTSKHVIQVLRMTKGEELMLTDGKGSLCRAAITNDNRKRCEVTVLERSNQESYGRNVTIAISLLKNASRFEWFLEKATEIGVRNIIPLICDRTEKERFRLDRMQQIVISAMLQSQQSTMPQLQEPQSFNNFIKEAIGKRFIAHCDEQFRDDLFSMSLDSVSSATMLIGPEGDFTPVEIRAALDAGYQPVSLGKNRLRTETAGIVAATALVLG